MGEWIESGGNWVKCVKFSKLIENKTILLLVLGVASIERRHTASTKSSANVVDNLIIWSANRQKIITQPVDCYLLFDRGVNL